MSELSKADLGLGEIAVLEHALGIDRPEKGAPGWRNFYAAGPDDAVTWDGLVVKGLAFEARSLNPADRVFLVTPRGKALMGAWQ